MILGSAATYLFGTLWLAFQMDLGFMAALSIGVLPYLAGDLIKILIAAGIGPVLEEGSNPSNQQDNIYFIQSR